VAGCARSALSPEGTNTSPYLCIEGLSYFLSLLAVVLDEDVLDEGVLGVEGVLLALFDSLLAAGLSVVLVLVSLDEEVSDSPPPFPFRA
jgi:hypothetical protein